MVPGTAPSSKLRMGEAVADENDASVTNPLPRNGTTAAGGGGGAAGGGGVAAGGGGGAAGGGGGAGGSRKERSAHTQRSGARAAAEALRELACADLACANSPAAAAGLSAEMFDPSLFLMGDDDLDLEDPEVGAVWAPPPSPQSDHPMTKPSPQSEHPMTKRLQREMAAQIEMQSRDERSSPQQRLQHGDTSSLLLRPSPPPDHPGHHLHRISADEAYGDRISADEAYGDRIGRTGGGGGGGGGGGDEGGAVSGDRPSTAGATHGRPARRPTEPTSVSRRNKAYQRQVKWAAMQGLQPTGTVFEPILGLRGPTPLMIPQFPMPPSSAAERTPRGPSRIAEYLAACHEVIHMHTERRAQWQAAREAEGAGGGVVMSGSAVMGGGVGNVSLERDAPSTILGRPLSYGAAAAAAASQYHPPPTGERRALPVSLLDEFASAAAAAVLSELEELRRTFRIDAPGAVSGATAGAALGAGAPMPMPAATAATSRRYPQPPAPGLAVHRVAPELGLRPVVNGSRPAPAVPGTIVLASENVAGAYQCALGTAPPGYGKGISTSPPRARPNSPASDAPPPSLPAPLAGVFTVATRSVHSLEQAVNEAAAARSMQLGWKWKLLVLRAQGAVLSAFFDAFVRFFEGLSSSTTGATGAIAGATGAVAGAPSVAAALEVGGEAAEGGGGEFGGQAAEGGVGEVGLAVSTLRPAATAQTPQQLLAVTMGAMLPKLRATSVSISRWARDRMERRVLRGECAWRHAATEELGAHQVMTQAASSLISSAAADPANAPHPMTIKGVRRASPSEDHSQRSPQRSASQRSPQRPAAAAAEHPIMVAAKGRATRQVASAVVSKPTAHAAAAAKAAIEATDAVEMASMRAACHPHASSDGQPAPTTALVDRSGTCELSRRDSISSAVPSSTRASPTPQGSGACAARAVHSHQSVHTNRSAGALPQSARAVSGAVSSSAGVSSSLAAPLRAREAAPVTAREAAPVTAREAAPPRPASARADARRQADRRPPAESAVASAVASAVGSAVVSVEHGVGGPPHSSASSITAAPVREGLNGTRLGFCQPPPDSSTPSASRPTSATPRGPSSAVVGVGLGVVVGAGVTSPRTGAAPPSAHDGAYPRRPLPLGSGRASVAATLAARSAAGKAIYGGGWDPSDPMQERARRAIAAVTAAGEHQGRHAPAIHTPAIHTPAIHRAPPPGHPLQEGQPLGAREQPARQAPSWAPSEPSHGEPFTPELFTPEHSLAPGHRGGDRPPPLLHRHAQAIGHSAVSGAESLIRSRSPATVVDKGEAAAELPAAARPSSPSDFE